MNEEEYFSLSFLPEELHNVGVFCGSKSGRDVDKVKECGLTVLEDQKAGEFSPASTARLIFCSSKVFSNIQCSPFEIRIFTPPFPIPPSSGC